MRWGSRQNIWRKRLVLFPICLGGTWYWLERLDYKDGDLPCQQFWKDHLGVVYEFSPSWI